MHAQVCSHSYIAYIIEMLDRYLSNTRQDHWKTIKSITQYLQRTKYFILIYRRSNTLDIVEYLEDFAGCLNNRKLTSNYVFMIKELYHGRV